MYRVKRWIRDRLSLSVFGWFVEEFGPGAWMWSILGHDKEGWPIITDAGFAQTQTGAYVGLLKALSKKLFRRLKWGAR